MGTWEDGGWGRCGEEEDEEEEEEEEEGAGAGAGLGLGGRGGANVQVRPDSRLNELKSPGSPNYRCGDGPLEL